MNRKLVKHYSGFAHCRDARIGDGQHSFLDYVTCDRCIDRIILSMETGHKLPEKDASIAFRQPLSTLYVE